jgi:hypothetical protein
MAKKSKKKKGKKSEPKRLEPGKSELRKSEKPEKVEEKKEISEPDYFKEIIKTFLPLIFGVVAGIVSFIVTGNIRTRDPLSIVVLVLFVYINKFIMPRFGVELQGKDWAGVGFLTLTTWYISWTLLLNL